MFYTTAKEDKIVNAVRKFFPTTVTANVSIPHATDTISLIDVFGFRILESDPLSHSLVDAYFKSEESLNNIKKGITYALKKLKFPGEPDKEPPANFTQYETNSNGSALIIHLEKKARRGHTFKIVSYSKGKRISSRGTIVSNNWMDMKYVLNYNEVPKDGLEMDIFLANKESWSPSFKTSCVLMIAGPDEVANRIHYRIPGGTYIKAAKVKITKNQGKVYISQQNFNVARN